MDFVECMKCKCDAYELIISQWHNRPERYCHATGRRIPCNKVSEADCQKYRGAK